MKAPLEHESKVLSSHSSQPESLYSKAYRSRTIVHAKLEMTEPGDLDEKEADAAANTVVDGGRIARQLSGSGSSGITVSQQMENRLARMQGGGQPMPLDLKSKMESAFGQEFSQVRLHVDSDASNLSGSISAKAFTLGNDIYFNNGQYSPDTSEGQRLIAHELAHVVQGSGKIGREQAEGQERNYSSPDTITESDLSTYEFLMYWLSKYIGDVDLQIFDASAGEEEETQYELRRIPGGGYVASKESFEMMERAYVKRRFLETLDNARGGFLGSAVPGLMMMFGVNDPDLIYGGSQMGGLVDAGFTGMYGGPLPRSTRNRGSRMPNRPVLEANPQATKPLRSVLKEGGTLSKPQAIQNIKARNNRLRNAYFQVRSNKTNLAPGKSVNGLIQNYRIVVRHIPEYDVLVSSTELRKAIFYEIEQLEMRSNHSQVE